jgi:hypothetical protein
MREPLRETGRCDSLRYPRSMPQCYQTRIGPPSATSAQRLVGRRPTDLAWSSVVFAPIQLGQRNSRLPTVADRRLSTPIVAPGVLEVPPGERHPDGVLRMEVAVPRTGNERVGEKLGDLVAPLIRGFEVYDAPSLRLARRPIGGVVRPPPRRLYDVEQPLAGETIDDDDASNHWHREGLQRRYPTNQERHTTLPDQARRNTPHARRLHPITMAAETEISPAPTMNSCHG